MSPRRLQLVRICQALNYGSLCGIRFEDGDSILELVSIVAEETA